MRTATLILFVVATGLMSQISAQDYSSSAALDDESRIQDAESHAREAESKARDAEFRAEQAESEQQLQSFRAEGDARQFGLENINRELSDQGRREAYNPEAAVARGIKPVPPKVPIGASPAVIAAQARAGVPIITPPGAPQGVSQERWQQYQFELQR